MPPDNITAMNLALELQEREIPLETLLEAGGILLENDEEGAQKVLGWVTSQMAARGVSPLAMLGGIGR